MGTLDIRQSSAQLNSLGQFRMPELDNGSAKAWEANARAAQSAANAAATAGRAAVEGISRRGQIVANTLNGLGKLAVDLFNRENERTADEAYLELKKRTTAELYGDENGKTGRLTEKPENVRAWMQSIRDWNDQTVGELSGKMNPAARRLFEKKIASQQVGLQSTVAQHAAQLTMAREKTTAEALSKDALDTAKLQFGNPVLRDAAIQSYIDAKNHEYDVLGIPEEARAPLMRTAMRDLVSGGWDATLTQWSAEISAEQDPEKVKKAWDAKEKEAEQAGYTLNCASISSYMPDGLTDAEKAMYKRRIDDAKKRSVSLAYQRQSEMWKTAANQAVQKEIELLKAPMPDTDEGKIARYRNLAAEYAKLADDKSLSPERQLSYTQMARRMEDAEARQNDAVKEANYRQLLREVHNNLRYSTAGDSQSISVFSLDDQKAAVDKAFKEKRITSGQWDDLSGRVHAKIEKKEQTAVDDDALEFLNAMKEKYNLGDPNAISYDRSRHEYQLKPNKKTKPNTVVSGLVGYYGPEKTGFWGKYYEKENVTYGQFLDACGIVLTKRRGNRNLTREQMEKEFDAIFAPAAMHQNAQSFAERQRMIRTATESAYKGTK